MQPGGVGKKIQTELGEENKLRRKFIHSWSFLFSFSFLFVFLSSAFAAADQHLKIFESPKEKKPRWSTKESRLSRSTPEERRKRLGSYLPFSTGRERTLAVPSLVLPTSLDWRNYNGSNYVTPVKEQGGCGACWAFATTAALESNVLISRNTPGSSLDLSEQTLISCSGAGTCYGGWIDAASDFIRDLGLPGESCYPFTATDGFCLNNCVDWPADAYKILDWYKVPPTVNSLKYALYNHGPLVALMAVHTDFFYYGSGVYTYTYGSFEGYHAALIVGYDDIGQCFIVKNSFGTDWGEDGYSRIAYGEIGSETTFGTWTIAYKGTIPADFPIIDGIPRETGSSEENDQGSGDKEHPTRSGLTGTVKDGSGKALRGASISVSAGKYWATTNQTGKYRISSIPPGNYIIIVSKEGYSSLSENLVIALDKKTTRDFVLSGSSSDETKDQGQTNDPPDNQGGISGPGWIMGKANPVSPEEAEAHFAAKRKEHALKSGKAPMASAAADSSPEIVELARGLRNDPKLIYDYVHNHIDYVPYFGSLKGATLTYLDGSGNDFDQASLMIALLRAAGFTAQYMYGTMTIPTSQTANWLGVDPVQPIINAVVGGGGGNAVIGSDGTIIMNRVWVKANINGSDYNFDPAFKSYTYVNKINIGQILGYNQSDFLTVAGGTVGDNGSSIMNLNETNLRSQLAAYASNLITSIRNQYPNYTVDQIIGGRSIVQTNLTDYPPSLPFSPEPTAQWTDIPAEYTTTLRIQHVGIDYTLNTPDLGSKRLTLTYAGSNYHPELRLDGSLLASGTATTAGSKNNLILTIDHPYAYNNGSYVDQTVNYSPESGRTYAVVYNFGGISNALIRKRQQQLETYRAQGMTDSSESVLGETLNIMGQTWVKEIAMSNRLFSELSDTVFLMHHNVGLMAQETGYYIDVKAFFCTITSRHLFDFYFSGKALTHFKATMLIGSAFEHGMLEQLMGSDKPGASTIKLFQIANFNGSKVYNANSSNYGAIQPQLQNYSSAELTDFQNQVNSGYTLILPDNGQLVLNQWKGKGYISKYFSESLVSMGMIIGGGYYGGFNSYQGPVDTPAISQATITNITAAPTPATIAQTVSIAPFSVSRDPVDVAGGAFLYDRTDLALGGSAPLGLAFSRSYNSNRNLSKKTLGYGFTHNYDIYLTPTSHGEPGFGYRQPMDAAGMIAAIYACLDLLGNQDTIKAWMAASLTAKWAVDQVIDNAVTVNLGGKAMEFIKLVDGTYSSSPGITTQMIKNGDGTYSLLERFGTRMNFNSDKKISQLIDINGNTMTFTYSGANLSTVRDAFNRTLTLQSSGSRISGLSDSAGRSVSYIYDANDNLTGFTDAAGKTWSFGYDSSHRMTSLTNPLGVTTATNVYDSLGQVKTQTVPRPGGGNATYNFYFSGFRNQEVDPAGNALTYYYDAKGREYAQENALGYKTIKEFDGQDHTIKVTDPRGYITSYTYDSNHNLTKVKNALNYEINNTYDSQYRLTDITDPLSHTTHFTYDSNHHLISTQDALGNTLSASYYANGLKNTATDGRATTTTLTYDGFGNPQTTRTGSHPPINYTYDSIGRMTSLTDQVGSTTSFVYENRNLMQSKTDPLNRTSNYTYDNAGRLSTKTDRQGQTITYAYTPSDKLATIAYSNASTVNFTYNNLDNLVGMQDSIGATQYTYDAANRLISMTDPHGFTVGYQYDQAGNLTQLTYPGNKIVTYTYDELNRLASVTNWLSQTATYTYDAAGRLTSLTNFNGTMTAYGYDNANRLTSQNSAMASYQFTLDGNGNRTNIVQNEPLMTALGVGTTPYTYNTQKNRLLSAGSNNFTYDNEGQLNSGYGSSYTFDYEHRLTGIGGDQFQYDGSGNRLQAVRSGVTTRYIYGAGGNLLAETDGSNTITKYYIHGLGLLAMVTPSNQTYCYHFNAVGSTIAMTDQSQTPVNKYAYDPFGRITNQVEAVPQPFKFVGQHGVMTEPNGFYYMRARYYDPGVGRFISEDPIGFEGGDVNLSAYVRNNPMMGIDPFGLDIWVAIRKADTPFNWFNGNHIYLWNTNLAEGWGTAGSGSSASHNHQETKPAPGMSIKLEIDKSQEAEFWKRWKDEGYADKGLYFPFISDCFTRPVALAEKFGVKLTIPWNRTGDINPVVSTINPQTKTGSFRSGK